MHYIFIESLGEDKYIGICVIFNNCRVRYPKNFFEFLRDLIENHCLENNRIISYSYDGTIIFKNNELCEDLTSYEFLKSYTKSTLESITDSGLQELKTKYNGTNKTVNAYWGESNDYILNLTDSYNTVIINGNIGLTQNRTNKIISSLQQEIANNNETINELQEELTVLEKKKKQFRNIIFLIVIVLCCCAGIVLLYSNLSQTEDDLKETITKLDIANDSIVNNNNTIYNLNNEINNLRTLLIDETRLRENAESLINKLYSSTHIIISGTSFSFYSGIYTVDYFSDQSGTKTFNIKVYKESDMSPCYTTTISPYLEKGKSTFSVNIYTNLNSTIYYVFEIWLGNRLVGGSRH